MTAFGDVTLAQYVLVAVAAFAAAVLGGVAGYGTGLLLPPILLPIVGPEAVVPIIGASAVLTNLSRFVAFREAFDRRKAGLIILCAAPTCLFGAYGYTKLSGAGVTLLIGVVLILLVPLRRLLARAKGHLGRRGVMIGGAGYGLLLGGTSGSGVALLSILLASGSSGTAVIAIDAGISVALGIAKVGVFQTAGALPASSWIMALLIGAVATPAAFVAKRFVGRLSGTAHLAVLDAVVLFGGAVLVVESLRRLV